MKKRSLIKSGLAFILAVALVMGVVPMPGIITTSQAEVEGTPIYMENGVLKIDGVAWAPTDVGYRLKEWTVTKTGDSTTTVETSGTDNARTFTMPGYAVDVSATFEKIPASAPTITTHPQNLNLTYGYASGNVLTVSASVAEDHTATYQWYSNTSESNENGTIISGATNASYTVPSGKAAGTKEYYYCVVTATRTDNDNTATATSNVSTVNVGKATPTITILPTTDAITYGVNLAGSALAGGKAVDEAGEPVPGTFKWKNESTAPAVLDSNNTEYDVTFTPTDTTNYNETTCKVKLKVNPKPVTITGLTASNKTYDGNSAASFAGTPVVEGVLVSDRDDVSVYSEGASATFEDANAGTDKTVRFSGFLLTGDKADNYILSSQPANVKANIEQKEATFSWTNNEFTYNGNEHCPTATVSNLVDGDSCFVTVTGGQTKVGSYTAEVTGVSNTNYKLPTETEGMRTDFTIGKTDAPAPATITKKYMYSKGGSDSFSLTGLPADCGAVTWKEPTASGSLTYQTAPSVTDEGVLSYSVKSGTKDSCGTIVVTAETENYKDITFTVMVQLVDQTLVKPKSGTSVTLKNNTLTFGQLLSALTFNTAVFVTDDEEEKTVTGTLAWREPDTMPSAGTFGALWVFTPTDTKYASFEGVAAITVEKAVPGITELPIAVSITFGQILSDSALTGGKAKVGDSWVEGTFAWKAPSISPQVSDSAKTKYDVVFSPNGINYKAVVCGVTLTVNKADIPNSAITPPTAKTGLVYTGKAQELINAGGVGGNIGTMQYALSSGTASEPVASAYSASIPMGSEAGTYKVWYKAIGDGNHKDSAGKHTIVTINKANYGDKTITGVARVGGRGVIDLSAVLAGGVSTIEVAPPGEGSKLSTASIDGNKLKYKFKSEGVSVGNTETAVVTVTSRNYETYKITATITAIEKDVPELTAMDITTIYNGRPVDPSKISGTARVGETNVAGTWSFEDGQALTDVADSGTKTVVFTPTDADAYESVEATLTLTINKANVTGAPTYTKITTSGKTLADASLAIGTLTPGGGTLAWNDAETTVVTQGTAYGWIYTPADKANYNVKTGSIVVWENTSGGGTGGSGSGGSGGSGGTGGSGSGGESNPTPTSAPLPSTAPSPAPSAAPSAAPTTAPVSSTAPVATTAPSAAPGTGEPVTTTNPDGSTTTTTTTIGTDGSTTTTTTTVGTDGSKTTTTTTIGTDGSTTTRAVTTDANGNKRVTEQIKKPSGDYTRVTMNTTVKKDENGNIIGVTVTIGTEKKTGKTTQKASFVVLNIGIQAVTKVSIPGVKELLKSSKPKNAVALTKATTNAKNRTITIEKAVKSDGKTYTVTTLKKGILEKNKKAPKKILIKATGITKIEKNAFKGIDKKANITIKASKKQFKKIKKLIQKSGIPKKVKIKRA